MKRLFVGLQIPENVIQTLVSEGKFKTASTLEELYNKVENLL